jgi:hypothetical protein
VSIPVIDPKQFRLKVAGLIDPNRKTGQAEEASIKEEAKSLCLILCELFGESLDRMTLWDRIATALKTSAAKCDDGDTDRFVSLCLESIKADDAAAARHQEFSWWVSTMSARDDAHRQAFIRHINTKTPIVLVHARNAWEERKQIKKGVE